MKQKRYGPGLRMFRDKYPAILLALALFFAVDLQAQQNDSTRYTPNNAYGTRSKRSINDSLAMIPLWESPHTGYRPGGLYYRKADSAVYVWTGSQKLKISGAGGAGIDTAYSMDDSVVVIESGANVFAMIVRGVYDYRRKVDTLYKVNDSTISFTINGDTRTLLMRGSPKVANGLQETGGVIRWGRILGTSGAELETDTEIPLNGHSVFFTDPASVPYTQISKTGIEIWGDAGVSLPAKLRLANLTGPFFNLQKSSTRTFLNFGLSELSVRDSDGSYIFTKTPGTSPTAFHDVDGTGRYRDTLTITTMDNADSSDRAASTAFVKRNAGSLYTAGFGLSLDGLEFKVDSTKIATLRAIQDSVSLILNNFSLISRIEFLQGASTSATYQNDTLINKNITALEIQGYSVGFTPRTNSVYISGFDSSTGTITLTNGVFDAGDFIKILFRSPPIFLLGPDGWPIKDITGQYIILN